MRQCPPKLTAENKKRFVLVKVNIQKSPIKLFRNAGCWWLTAVILATWEADIERLLVLGYPRQIVHKTPSPK
jgi:hypothetical protein